MNDGRTRVRVITFTDEFGVLWALRDFCHHHGANERSVRHKWYKLGRPQVIETRELISQPQHGGNNSVIVTALMPDGSRKTFGSAKEMSEFAAKWGESLETPQKFAPATIYSAWRDRLSRAKVFKITSLFVRPTRIKASAMVEMDVPKGDLAHLSGRRTKDREARLSIIPGPSKYERAYLDDAGKFGAGQVQQENFSGRCQGGAPIYTGR